MEVGSIVVEASSSQMVTRQQKRAMDAVMFQVLDNPSSREEILKQVILGKGKVDRKAACNLRLVHSSWNESVVRILRKAHEHLFKLGKITKEAVDPFVETFAASPQIMGSIPPLAIHDFEHGDLCCPENLESFSNCLARCGDGLIQLGFQITENGRPFKAVLPNWSLPCLHWLNISLTQDLSGTEGQGEMAVAEDQNADNLSTCLVKSVMRNATALSELELQISFRYSASREISEFPVFYSVILPPSLTKFTAFFAGSTQHLEMLAKSPLPNLKSLTMCVGRRPFSDGLILRILENCRASLKTLRLCGIAYGGQPGAHDVTRFPVMEQLVELKMEGVNVELELGRDPLDDKYFPKLTTLRLRPQSTENFQRWLGSSPVPGVTSLTLFLEERSKASLSMDAIQRVDFIFPNLHKLGVTMSSEDSSVVQYIFREMRQLTELEIKVKCYMLPITSSDIWDSLLTGVSAELIARSKVDPDFSDINNLEGEVGASIKNLSELRTFSFRVLVGGFDFVDEQFRPMPTLPSISDFLFNCALLKMPKLVELHLRRTSSYNVSEEMIAKWRNDGRSLILY